VRLLLDANIAVWLLTSPARIKPTIRMTIAESENFVSTASLLEITSKAASGRLVFTDGMREDLRTICDWLPVKAEHAFRVQTLPRIHNDPFDRIIVAQAMIEDMTIVTGDRVLLDYGVSVLLT